MDPHGLGGSAFEPRTKGARIVMMMLSDIGLTDATIQKGQGIGDIIGQML
jgi:hypothetical protein